MLSRDVGELHALCPAAENYSLIYALRLLTRFLSMVDRELISTSF